jgi:CHAD domain-containing protein
VKQSAHALAAAAADTRRRLRRREELARHCGREPARGTVHEFRIETRRVLAALALLESLLPADELKAARKELKRQLRATGKLRDLQVQRALLDEFTSQRRALAGFRRHLARREPPASRVLARKLGTRHRGRVQALAPVLASLGRTRDGGTDGMRRALQRAFVRMERLRRRDTNPRRLHRLRVALKRYRYMRDAWLGEGGEAEPFTHLRAAQKCLGELHDLTLLEARLRRFARRHPGSGPYGPTLRLLRQRRQTRERRQRRLVAAVFLPHAQPARRR